MNRHPAFNPENYGSSRSDHADLLAGLTGINAASEQALALRTRRAVYQAGVEQRIDRDRQRHHLAIALLISAALFFALAPALWDGIEGLLGGEGPFDLSGMLIVFGIALFAAVAAVLFLIAGEQRQIGPPRHANRKP